MRALKENVASMLYDDISGEKKIILDLYKTELTIVELEEELKKCYESDLHEKELLLENLKKLYKQDLVKIALLENFTTIFIFQKCQISGKILPRIT